MANFNITPDYLKTLINNDVTIESYVYKIRKASGITFVTLRNGRYLFQAVYIPDLCKTPLCKICEGAYIKAFATVKPEKRSEYGFELTLKSFDVLSLPKEEYPINVSQPTLGCTLDDNIKNRSLTLKHPTERAIIQIRNAVMFAFSDFMQRNDFVQINTPKISAMVSDCDYIKLHYFDRNGVLNHSPALYKIMAVGGLDRVYEIGAGYSSKSRNSLRHLNEFTRLDFELSYASREDICELLCNMTAHILQYISDNCTDELKILNATLTIPDSIVSLTHKEAMDMLGKPHTQADLDPTDESKLSKYAKDKFASDYIFITDLPDVKRPFYEKTGCGFVLLSNGIEIASGGEHISDYDEQTEKLISYGLNPDDYTAFLSAHKYALPPIGGVGIGLERFVMALLNLENIRRATLFTRDLHYLIP